MKPRQINVLIVIAENKNPRAGGADGGMIRGCDKIFAAVRRPNFEGDEGHAIQKLPNFLNH